MCRWIPAYPAERLALHAGRQRAGGAAQTRPALALRRDAACRPCVARLRPSAALGRTARHQPGAAAVGLTLAAPGLRDLHLRLHRPAQGRDGRAPRRGQPARTGCSEVYVDAATIACCSSRSLAFDASRLGALWPLLHGGGCWSCSPETARSPERLVQALADASSVTRCQLDASHAAVAAGRSWPRRAAQRCAT